MTKSSGSGSWIWKEEEFDEEFRQWILDFPKDQLPEIYALLEKYRGCRDIHIFRSRDEAEEYLERERFRIGALEYERNYQ